MATLTNLSMNAILFIATNEIRQLTLGDRKVLFDLAPQVIVTASGSLVLNMEQVSDDIDLR